MEIYEIAILMRGIERLGIILVSGIGIYMGAKLFLKGVVNAQAAEFEGGGWKIRLQKVGPGVFFALFGTAVLIYSISTKLEINDIGDTSAEPGKQKGFTVAYGAGGTMKTFSQVADATKMVEEAHSAQLDNQKLALANAILQKSRRELVVMYFGSKVYQECPKGGISTKYTNECKEIAKWYGTH